MTNHGQTLRFASLVALALVVLGLGAITIPSAQARTFTLLYNFPAASDGVSPYATLLQDPAGNLYGTTIQGGAYGYGVVFRLDTSANETVLYNFTGGDDGATPVAGGLIGDAAGNLYGMTSAGGYSGYGVVYLLDTSGTENVLHTFTGGTTDGCNPFGELVRDKKGNLYGTTSGCGANGPGAVFEVSHVYGIETVLFSFDGADGATPFHTSLLRDGAENFYGTTTNGGSSGNGVVYKLDTSGTETVLYNFAGGTADGCSPFGDLTIDRKGNLYGTTIGCGSSGNGIVWELSQTGTETVLHNFAGGTADGAGPQTGVILDPKGNIYGATVNGGAYGYGTVFRLNKSGKLTLLHSFHVKDGAFPIGGVIWGANGSIYGTCSGGGIGGSVWQLTP